MSENRPRQTPAKLLFLFAVVLAFGAVFLWRQTREQQPSLILEFREAADAAPVAPPALQ